MRLTRCGPRARRISLASVPAIAIMVPAVLFCVALEPERARSQDALRVRLQAAPGPYYVGQGIELTAQVLGHDQRPKIELPRVSHADIWIAGTSFNPVSANAIGSVESGDNLYLTRLRIVPRRTGPLEIPPIVAQIDGRSGRSKPLRLAVEAVPLEGRPAEFLGGVGEFSAQASVQPGAIRIGQEFIYRIEITGPAAWGTSSRPDLSRFQRIPLAPLRIEDLPDERTNEPPSTAFVYRIRPSRPGDAVLPPVIVAAFDPRVMRYITKATPGVQIKAAAVAAFDPGTIHYRAPDSERTQRIAWTSAGLVLSLCALLGLGVVLQRRRRRARQTSLRQAQRKARRMVRELGDPDEAGAQAVSEGEVARRIIDGLIAYARLGIGRPPGALTPVEARAVVYQLSRSEDLGTQAAAVVSQCDGCLFSERRAAHDAQQLVANARELFQALGRVSVPREETPFSESPAHASE